MTNEEMKSLYESLNSVEDAYALMKDNGYTGTMEDFLAMCAKAADDMSMNVDDMEQVAGGMGMDDVKNLASAAWDKTTDVLGKTWDWMKENPGAAAGIVGGAVVATVGITYVVRSSGGSSTPTPTSRVPKEPFQFGTQEPIDLSVKGDGAAYFDALNPNPSGMRESVSSAMDPYAGMY